MASTDARRRDVNGPHHLWAKYGYITDSQLFREYLKRLSIGRDMHVIITASSETGVGKTTLAVSLALLWDQHGWQAEKAAVADAAEYSYKYDRMPPGSVLILDEAEKAADARRGQTHGNVDVSQAFAAKRFRQVFGILTAPSKGWVDQRLGSSAADYWIQALESEGGGIKGEARVYRLKEQEHYETYYSRRTELIEWPILDSNRAYKELDRIKQERLSGDIESNYVHRRDVEEMKENYWNKATKRTGYDIAQAALDLGFTQKETAKLFSTAGISGFSQPQISRVKSSDGFDDWYGE